MDIAVILENIDKNNRRLNELRPLDNQSIVQALDIEYTYESNRIEGNSLSLRETSLIIEKGLTVGGKSLRDHLEAKNHYEAIQYIRSLVETGRSLTESTVKQIHALVLSGIDRENAGVYRQVPVMISGSTHRPVEPWRVPILMEETFRWYQENRAKVHPVVLAAEMHERIATIHPFIDGNGRTSRLVMNIVLLQAGYTIANIAGDSETRLRYYNALEKCNRESSKTDFIKFVAEQVVQFQDTLIGLVSPPGMDA